METVCLWRQPGVAHRVFSQRGPESPAGFCSYRGRVHQARFVNWCGSSSRAELLGFVSQSKPVALYPKCSLRATHRKPEKDGRLEPVLSALAESPPEVASNVFPRGPHNQVQMML